METVLASLDDAKAEDTVTIDIQNKSSLGDYMVVASGRSHRHVGAIADRLVADLKKAGFGPVRVEGLPMSTAVGEYLPVVVTAAQGPELLARPAG